MKDLGSSKRILGMQITRDRDKGIMTITQENYAKRILLAYK